MSDIIFLNGMRFYGYHGALHAENELGQIFIVDVTLKVDLTEAGKRIMSKTLCIMVRSLKMLKTLLKGHLVN